MRQFNLNLWENQLDVSNFAATAGSNQIRPIVIAPPMKFTDEVQNARTMATKSRHSNILVLKK